MSAVVAGETVAEFVARSRREQNKPARLADPQVLGVFAAALVATSSEK